MNNMKLIMEHWNKFVVEQDETEQRPAEGEEERKKPKQSEAIGIAEELREIMSTEQRDELVDLATRIRNLSIEDFLKKVEEATRAHRGNIETEISTDSVADMVLCKEIIDIWDLEGSKLEKRIEKFEYDARKRKDSGEEESEDGTIDGGFTSDQQIDVPVGQSEDEIGEND